MSIAVVNRRGFFMALAAFGLAYALRLQWPSLSDAILLALVAGLFVALDILWRIGKGKRKWFRPGSGGSIFYLPLWFLGVAWLGLCVYQMYVRPIPALAGAAPQMTWTTSANAQQQSSAQPQTQAPPAKAKSSKR